MRRAPVATWPVIAWAFVVAYGYPGRMSTSALGYARAARSRFFDDDASPGLIALWRATELFVAGPTGLLLLQTSLVAFGAHALLRHHLAPRAAAVVIAAAMVWPPVMVAVTEISPAAMAAAWLLIGAAGLKAARPRASIAALLIATAVEPAALVATLPLLIAWMPGAGRRRIVIVGATWLAITGAALGLDTVLALHHRERWSAALARDVIVGTLARVEATIPDGELTPLLAGTGARVTTEVHAAVRAAEAAPDSLWMVPADGSAPAPSARRAISAAASEVIGAHPGAYLRARLARLGEVLMGQPAIVRDTTAAAIAAGVPTRTSALQDTIDTVIAGVAETFLFAPWLYLGVAAALAFVARRREVIALVASGILLEASRLVTVTDVDVAMASTSGWLVIATVLAAAIAVASRRGRAA
jgi:hypothetical protein